MTEVLFYHLEHQPLDRVLPKLVKSGLDRGWRMVVQVGSAERAEAISTLLWTFDEEAFLPHGTRSDGFGDLQPVWITDSDDTPNGATVRFFVDGASPSQIAALDRAVIIFDGSDEVAVQAARNQWKSARSAGYAVSYWQQDEHGRWQNRAASSSLPSAP